MNNVFEMSYYHCGGMYDVNKWNDKMGLWGTPQWRTPYQMSFGGDCDKWFINNNDKYKHHNCGGFNFKIKPNANVLVIDEHNVFDLIDQYNNIDDTSMWIHHNDWEHKQNDVCAFIQSLNNDVCDMPLTYIHKQHCLSNGDVAYHHIYKCVDWQSLKSKYDVIYCDMTQIFTNKQYATHNYCRYNVGDLQSFMGINDDVWGTIYVLNKNVIDVQ